MGPIQFGILMVDYQAIDAVGPLDVLNSSSKEYVAGMESFGRPHVPKGLAEHAIDVQFHHINETMDPIVLTGNLHILPTTTCDSCPDLDYLLVGGPSNFDLKPRFTKFVQDHVAAGKVLFTTCTGGALVAGSGVLDGKVATTNHEVIPLVRNLFPKVKWTNDKQWEVDGNIWTAGGAVAGMDMMAHWVRQKYGEDVANAGLAALDFEPRAQNGEMVLSAQHWLKIHAGR